MKGAILGVCSGRRCVLVVMEGFHGILVDTSEALNSRFGVYVFVWVCFRHGGSSNEGDLVVLHFGVPMQVVSQCTLICVWLSNDGVR